MPRILADFRPAEEEQRRTAYPQSAQMENGNGVNHQGTEG
jgi:hypothetical protein